MRGGIAGAAEERDALGTAARRGSPLRAGGRAGCQGTSPSQAPAPALRAERRLLGHVKSLGRLRLRRRQSAAGRCKSSAGAEPPAPGTAPRRRRRGKMASRSLRLLLLLCVGLLSCKCPCPAGLSRTAASGGSPGFPSRSGAGLRGDGPRGISVCVEGDGSQRCRFPSFIPEQEEPSRVSKNETQTSASPATAGAVRADSFHVSFHVFAQM